MAQLELQLNTAKADAALKQVETSLASLTTAMQGLGKNAPQVEQTKNALANFKGPSAATVKNVSNLKLALANIKLPVGLSLLSKSFAALAAIDISQVSRNAGTLAKNLAKIQHNPAIRQMANDLGALSIKAERASMAMMMFKASVTGIRTPPALQGINRNLGKLPGSFNKANSAAQQFNNSIRTMRNLSGGLAAAMSAWGVSSFIKGSTEAVMKLEQFNVVMKTVTGSAEGAEDALAFLRNLGKETAQPITTLTHNFAKFTAAAVNSNFTLDQTKKTFAEFTKVGRVLGMSTENMNLMFLALEQMMSKGAVSSEELRRQLGERLYGAFTLAAEAMNVTTGELQNMLKNGEVMTKDFLPKFSKIVMESYGKGLPDAMQKVSAALGRVNAAFVDAQLAFGNEFWLAAKEAVFGLADAMEKPAFQQFAADMGKIAGSVASGVVKFITWLTENIWALKAALAGVGLATFAVSLGALGGILSMVAGGFTHLIGILGYVMGGFKALTSVPAALNVVRLAIAGVTLAARALAMTPLGLAMTALGIAAFGAAQHFGLFEKAAAALGFSSKEASESTKEQKDNTEALAQAQKNAEEIMSQTVPTAQKMGQTFKSTGTDMVTIANEARKTRQRLKEFEQGAREAGEGVAATANYLDDFEAAARDSGTSADALAKQTGDAALASGKLADGTAEATGKMAEAAAKADDLRRKYEALARAARDAAKAMASAGGGSSRVGAQRQGGMAGQATQSQSVNMSVFKNAPRFANGTANTSAYSSTVPGGGIPSILHPNEAVVPLSGGRSIPVTITTTSAGTSASFSGTNDKNVVSVLIKILDAINAAGGMGALPTNVSSNGRVGGTIGGQFSLSTGGGGGGVGSISAADRLANHVNTFQKATQDDITGMAREFWIKWGMSQGDALKAARQVASMGLKSISEYESFMQARVDQAAKDTSDAFKFLAGAYQNHMVGMGPGYSQIQTAGRNGPGALTSTFNNSVLLPKTIPNAGTGGWTLGNAGGGILGPGGGKGKSIGAQPIGGASMQGFQVKGSINPSKEAGNMWDSLGFASGSPNVFNEATGRSAMVRIHPDEAVIPLPDGRAVPVKFPDEERGGGRGGTKVDVGGITIMANNPMEFEKASARMEAELRKRLQRANSRRGLTEGPR